MQDLILYCCWIQNKFEAASVSYWEIALITALMWVVASEKSLDYQNTGPFSFGLVHIIKTFIAQANTLCDINLSQ